MTTACVYPGTFDPITLGHLDVIERASSCFDSVTVAVLVNSKKQPVFTIRERIDFIKRVTRGLDNVKVDSFNDGLLVDYARNAGATLILRGLRAISDFDYEYQMASLNSKLAPDLETIFMMTSTAYAYLSSSIVKEIGSLGGDISGLVPAEILCEVKNRLRGSQA